MLSPGEIVHDGLLNFFFFNMFYIVEETPPGGGGGGANVKNISILAAVESKSEFNS